PTAVRRIFELKGRPADHPLIVHLADAGAMAQWARDIPAAAWRLAEAFWPGPLTLILPRGERVPLAVTGGQESVGLRVPAHPLALELLRSFGGALAAPSANRFGRISPTSALHVLDELGEELEMILDGGSCQVGVESTIVSLLEPTPRLLRPGGVPLAALEQLLGGEVALAGGAGATPRAPGMLASHYAPATPLELWPGETLGRRLLALVAAGERMAVLAFPATAARLPPATSTRMVVMPLQVMGYARQLYATLRSLDAGGYSRLLVEQPPATGEWLAVRDRLERAAAES
ncbi:MAG: threonylcarbamoyl-AMP synthase, partial [Desulfuromonadales bacterium]|nr:threonylcarbamoyl-AMP synthase [Desulfuromonadales bacterium]